MPAELAIASDTWTHHNRRIRRLQRVQLVALVLVCAGSLMLLTLLGRSLVSESDRQALAADQRAELITLSSDMLTTEGLLWRALAEGEELPLDKFVTDFAVFQRGVMRLADAHAGGDGPRVVAARAALIQYFAEANRLAAKVIVKGGSAREAIAATDRLNVEMSRAMDEWVAAASAEGATAAAESRRLSRRLIWWTLGFMGVIGLGGLLSWLLTERSRVRLSQAIGESEEHFRSLVQNSSDGVMVIDRAGVVKYVAASAERLLGIPAATLIGRSFGEVIGPGTTGPLAQFVDRGVAVFDTHEPIVWQAVYVDGSVRYLESIASNRLDEPPINGIVLNTRDVTDRHEMAAQLSHRALHDPLTDLANRTLFQDRVEHALTLGRRERRTVAVLLIDLDDFKTVNDSLGHAAGDALVVEVAARISRSLRVGDTAARLGGDEFVVLLETPVDRYEVEALAQRLVDAISEPTLVEGRELVIQASMGIAFADDENATAESLLRDADVAMYQAKDRGRAGFVVFDPSMTQRVTDRLGLVADLHRAIERGEMSVAYQPIVALEAGQICGVEALLRWRHPARGNIEPSVFIPLAEETGQIQAIGRWVLRTALREIMALRADAGVQDVELAINVSTRQLEREEFAEQVAAALHESGFPAGDLTLEITESALMRDPEMLLRQLELLKALGVTIAIDDFGTGYSSLAYIARLPIDIVKIDRSFVNSVATSSRDSRIAQMIMSIGSSLSLRTVAEGVEQLRQMEALTQLGCEMAQGYLFGAAIPADQLRALLVSGLPALERVV